MMKLTMDERVKQRMVGIAVILSICAIFLPAIFKKSSQPFDGLSRVAVRMPAKPEVLTVKTPDAQAMFAKVKNVDVKVESLAKTKKLTTTEPIALAKEDEPVKSVEVEIAKADQKIKIPFKIAMEKQEPSHISDNIQNIQEKPITIDKPKSIKAHFQAVRAENKIIISPRHNDNLSVTKLSKIKKTINKPALYSIQVASFAKLQNATAMVTKLKSHGYNVYYKSTKHAQGKVSYQIIVGQSKTLEEVHHLQQKLVNQMQLNGFVVIG